MKCSCCGKVIMRESNGVKTCPKCDKISTEHRRKRQR